MPCSSTGMAHCCRRLACVGAAQMWHLFGHLRMPLPQRRRVNVAAGPRRSRRYNLLPAVVRQPEAALPHVQPPAARLLPLPLRRRRRFRGLCCSRRLLCGIQRREGRHGRHPLLPASAFLRRLLLRLRQRCFLRCFRLPLLLALQATACWGWVLHRGRRRRRCRQRHGGGCIAVRAHQPARCCKGTGS